MQFTVSPMLSLPPLPQRGVDQVPQDGPSNLLTVAYLASQIVTISTSIIRRIEKKKHESTEVQILARSIHTVHGLAGTLSTWRVQHTGTTTFSSTDTISESLTMLLLRLQSTVRGMQELSTFVDDFLLFLEGMREVEKQKNKLFINSV